MRTCLIVDKGDIIRNTAYRYLTGHDFSVQGAEDAEQALFICRKRMPDVILVDDSANVSGCALDFVRKLDGSHSGTRPVVIYCSRERDAARVGAALWEGATECLMKPFDADLLDFKLRQSGIIERR